MKWKNAAGFGGLLALACALCGSAADAPSDRANRRTAWQFDQESGVTSYVRVKGAEWAAVRKDGKREFFDEVERSDESVVLQNRQSKLFVRLTADYAYWKRPSDAEWTRWIKGHWFTEDELATVEKPKPVDYRLRLAYFVPKDREPTANYERKIRVVMAYVADFYRRDLLRKRHKTEGLKLESKDDQPAIHLIRGQHPAAYYNNAPKYDASEQWRRLVPEIREAIGDPNHHLIVAFTETYDDGPADHAWPGVMARGAYYGADGGLAIYSAHILRDEFCAVTVEAQRRLFFDNTPVPGRKALGHRMNSPRCEFVEDGIGALAHELGHALGLPHDLRSDDVNIMGNGFRNLRLNLSPSDSKGRLVEFSADNARLLMSSRYIAADLKLDDNQPPRVDMTIRRAPGKAIIASFKCSDDNGLRAMVLFDAKQDSVVAGRELQGKEIEFQQNIAAAKIEDGQFEIRAIVTDNGGNHTRLSQQFRLSTDSL